MDQEQRHYHDLGFGLASDVDHSVFCVVSEKSGEKASQRSSVPNFLLFPGFQVTVAAVASTLRPLTAQEEKRNGTPLIYTLVQSALTTPQLLHCWCHEDKGQPQT